MIDLYDVWIDVMDKELECKACSFWRPEGGRGGHQCHAWAPNYCPGVVKFLNEAKDDKCVLL